MDLDYTLTSLRSGTIRRAGAGDPVVSWLINRRILTDDVTAEPSAPVVGDTYLIPDDATGPLWSNEAYWGMLVTWTPQGIWEGIVAPDGLLLTYEAGGAIIVGSGVFPPEPIE